MENKEYMLIDGNPVEINGEKNLLEVIRNPEEDKGRRMQAATLAAPYCHPKKGESGKKEEKAAAAKRVASRFTPAAPPRLAAANGKKV